MKKTKILYVEDEPSLAHIVKDTLESKGFEVVWISDGSKVVKSLNSFHPDLCLFDVMLPNVDGFTLGKRINIENPGLPIIFLTAKSQTSDVVEGFKSGGNDYLKKPFSLEELLVRINNILQLKSGSGSQLQNDCIPIGKYLFYPKQMQLHLGKEEQSLTYRETEVIDFFAQHINQIIEKKEILFKIWGDNSFYNARNLDVYIKKLRDYFAADSKISILTLRGLGYRFNVDSSL